MSASDLAALFCAVLRDKEIYELKAENERLYAKVDEFRALIPSVLFLWSGPPRGCRLFENNDPFNSLVYLGQRIDLFSDRPDSDLVLVDFGTNADGIPLAFHLRLSDVLLSEVRFGEFFVAPAKSFSFSIRLDYLDLTCGIHPPILRVGFVRECVCGPGEIISIHGYFQENFSIEQYSGLSGMSVDEIKLKYNIDALKDGNHDVQEQSLPIQVSPEVLEKVVGSNCVLDVCSFACPFGLIKKKCHLV